MNSPGLQRTTFLLLLVLVTIGFLAILHPFYESVLWAAILALLFAPLNRRLLHRMPKRRNLAAGATLMLILFVVILPVTLISVLLAREGTAIYGRIRSGELNFANYLKQIVSVLPQWLHDQLEQFGLLDLAGVQDRLSESAARLGQFLAPQAINIGQNTVSFVVGFGIMLYLLFFLLRDGPALARRIQRSIPIADEQKQHLLAKFSTVIKATVKGNLAVAVTQGALGGLILWALGIQGALLWGVLMVFLSLLPAVGAGLIWGPVAIYFLATGALWQGAVLIAFGVFVIGLVDNILRPILVGKDTKMPDYVVLISTVGGLSLFGLSGFVIGPLIAAMFMATWDLFASPERVRAEHAAERDGTSPAP